MSHGQSQAFSGRTRSALAAVIEGLSHSIIDNLYVRFEVEDHRISARMKPNKLSKAARLVEVVNGPEQASGDDPRELLRYIVEDVHGGDLSKDWHPLQNLQDALESDGYSVVGGRLILSQWTSPRVKLQGQDHRT